MTGHGSTRILSVGPTLVPSPSIPPSTKIVAVSIARRGLPRQPACFGCASRANCARSARCYGREWGAGLDSEESAGQRRNAKLHGQEDGAVFVENPTLLGQEYNDFMNIHSRQLA